MTPAERIRAAQAELALAEQELRAALAADKTRRRGELMRQLHEVQRMRQPDLPYASQAGQDRVIDRALGGKEGGTFVDIGAYDGLNGSNSLFFERIRGWSGVMVEPVPAMRQVAERYRSAPCLPYAVADARGEAAFVAVTAGYTQMSGLVSDYDPDLLQTVRADPRHAEEMLMVQTVAIADIFEEAGLTSADFVSLDIEGGELTALTAFPFADLPVTAWAIENNSGASEIAKIMRENGYNLIEFCGQDEIYLIGAT